MGLGVNEMSHLALEVISASLHCHGWCLLGAALQVWACKCALEWVGWDNPVKDLLVGGAEGLGSIQAEQ